MGKIVIGENVTLDGSSRSCSALASAFGETSEKKSMRLVGTRTVGESLAHLRYEVVREA
jgi:hypothetical protein